MAQLARAVRKAVSSSALINATGVPSGEKILSDPRGVVLSELEIEGAGCGGVLELEDDMVDTDPRDDCGDLEEESDSLSTLGVLESSGACKVTTFIPSPFSLLAGINSVVLPSLLLRDVRRG